MQLCSNSSSSSRKGHALAGPLKTCCRRCGRPQPHDLRRRLSQQRGSRGCRSGPQAQPTCCSSCSRQLQCCCHCLRSRRCQPLPTCCSSCRQPPCQQQRRRSSRPRRGQCPQRHCCSSCVCPLRQEDLAACCRASRHSRTHPPAQLHPVLAANLMACCSSCSSFHLRLLLALSNATARQLSQFCMSRRRLQGQLPATWQPRCVACCSRHRQRQACKQQRHRLGQLRSSLPQAAAGPLMSCWHCCGGSMSGRMLHPCSTTPAL